MFIKVALEGLTPIQLVFGRMLAAAVAMLAFLQLRRDRLPREPAVWLHLAVMAAITNLVPYFLFAVAEQRVSSSLAGALNATTPLLTLLLALGVRMERPTLPKVGGLVLGFLGAGLLVSGPGGHGHSTIGGVAAALAASFAYAVSFLYARRFLTQRPTSALALSTGQMVLGAALAGVLVPAFGWHATRLTPAVVASVLILGAIGTGAAYVLNYRLIADEGATAAASVIYLLPVVAILLGVIVLGDPLTWQLVAGAVVVMAGVALSQSPGSHRSHPIPASTPS